MKRLLTLLGLMLWASLAGAVQDFTFLHLSDMHTPYLIGKSRETVAALPRGEVQLTPYGITAPAPSFAIVTGDLTEYGGGSGSWEQYLGLWQGLPFPVHHELGNHDNTWDCNRPRLRAIEGSPFYAFEQDGVKFIGWDDSTPQDPRPSIATEGLLWLRAELARTPPEQPIIFFCHHPIEGTEFAGAYDRARLLDVLRTRNVVCILVGHGHGQRAWQIEGFDVVMGGNTYSDTRGFGIVSIQANVLRVCHQFLEGDKKLIPLLEKPLPTRSPFLQVAEIAPADGFLFGAEETLRWRVRLAEGETAAAGRWLLDGKAVGEMMAEEGAWVAQTPAAGLAPGAHTVRFELTAADGVVTSRTQAFWLNTGDHRIAWLRQLPGSCQSSLTLANGTLYAGDNAGGLNALDPATGETRWRFQTAGEVRSQPVVAGGVIYFGSADGTLSALNQDGQVRWRSTVGSPVYATPLVVGDQLICGTNSGEVVAVDRATGALRWRSSEPKYTIETPAASDGQTAYLGSWDRYLYALDVATGRLRWRVPSRGSDRPGDVARYYSPADCGPVVCGGNVFVADRAYCLSIIEAATGKRLADEENCAAVSLAADGQSVHVRHSDGKLSRRKPDGTAIWTTEIPTGSLQTPPVEAGGKVLVVSTLGTLSVLDAQTGKVLWQYRAFPDIYAFSAPTMDAKRVYLADMAGHVLALEQ